MAGFSYTALNTDGKLIKGVIEGDSERHVRSLLRGKQLKPIDVSAAHNKNEHKSTTSSFFSPRISSKDLALITRQLATLIQSNLPLDEAIAATAQQTRKPKLKSVMMQVRARVVEGHSLAYGLGDFPRVFNEMYVAMVRAGEHAGFLGTVMQQLADYTENSQYTQQKLKMAMIYPIILMLVAIAVIGLLMVFVVPQLVGLFINSKTELPALTQALISTSHFVENYTIHTLLAIAAVIWGFRRLLENPGRRYIWHKIVLKIPFIGSLFTAMDTARFASTLSILVQSGVPLLDGLRIAGEVMSNLVLRDAAKSVAITVGEGSSLNKALNETGVFPPLMVHMVASGEASGELEAMLSRSAQNQERELEMTLGSLMAIIEPLMVVIMASVVGVIVMAILLPIIQMNNLVR
jgi:general secretion pathway protein F